MKSVFLALFAAIFVIASPLHAEDSKAPIVVVNLKKILNDSKAAKGVQEQIEAERKKIQGEVSKQEEDLRKEDKKLAEQRSVLSAEAFGQKQKEFKNKVTAAQRDVQNKRAKLEKAYNDALAEVQKTVTTIITEQAAKKGFVAAIPSNITLYSDPKMDITEEVLKQLNDRLSKVKVNVQ